MNFTAGLFAEGWLWGAYALTAVVLVWIIRTGPWASLRRPERINVWLGTSVALMVVWRMKAGVLPGLDLHLLGAMVATLLFGPQLAMALLGIVLAAVMLATGGDWPSLGLNWLVMVVWPVLVADGVRRLVAWRLPRHFFVYVFVVAFFGSAATVMAQGVLASVVLSVADVYSLDFLASDYLPYFLLLGFSEAWLSGAVITVMVIYRPDWVASFDDHLYLKNK
ncbi:MAG TPA: energy-coupling factor ABC transporter permease [Denitromonas sp.]|uniref:energy-coupling factor ABC transporter permease n=1 Tax=Denitromonas sp. TaxID=2734609 RepID=UPI001DBF1B72|nr:energy-coupling factor ABC transporter permease [Rhodocyclaceae bacterium]MCP5220119.1 energy-coupling factor ABC transporter permease [Zoogloeaceae bacterium]HPR05653.1 energy-coupling factor ABC transporter permease [Denitromonas sp.]HQU87424.1 energy-coupling factor ABC transporter permease [Denitromonas sp.]HQV13390.1 energy-coupling factor ABC transporter permease [Denitromonas sp.]